MEKIYQTYLADGVDISRDQVEDLYHTYWDLFSGLRKYSRQLEREWLENGGYILNGLGRPMCVTEDYKKDLLNRVIQSTGHDLLVKYTYILTKKLDSEGVPWKPIIIDLHDATTVEVPEAYGQQAANVMKWAMDELNSQVAGTIKLSGVPVVGENMADVKEPEE